MTSDMRRRLEEYQAQQADRPFGDVESVSGVVLQPFSLAGQEAAGNLLDKAHRALDAGDADRARAFVDRACKLPYDDHEQTRPVAWVVHMELFDLVSDALEDDDPLWLDAAIEVVTTDDEATRFEMRAVLAIIDTEHELTRLEGRRLRVAVEAVPVRAALYDLDLGVTELGDQVMSVLAACRRYEQALRSRSS